VKRPIDFITSPDDKATFARWRRGVVLLYGRVALFIAVALVLTRFAELALQVAGK
jgi:hypothetical protein